jgi:hypothetical protein
MKRFISIVLSLVMVFTVGSFALSSNVFAENNDTTKSETSTTEYTDEQLGEIQKALALNTANVSLKLANIKAPTSWADFQATLLKILYNIADKIIDLLVKSINSVIPSVNFESKDKYVNDQFYKGMDTYLTQPAADAVWSLGYGSASLQTGDELDGEHYVGGSLSFPKTKAATAIYDDQRVRCIAMNDGSGRGTVVFAVIDGFGLSNTDVRGIRAQLVSFARANNIVSINISVLHQHSCVDTFGMNGDLVKMLFANPAMNVANNTFGTNFDLLCGQNKSFMQHLYKVTVQSVKDAVNSMTTGKLYYSEINAADYIRDKREPKVYDKNIHRLRFVPDNGDRETWLCNMAIHCVGNGAAGTEVTGDYPYYMEQVINERANANFIQIQGAELAITSEYKTLNTENMTRLESLKVYGTALGNLVVDSKAAETEVAPLLNIKLNEYYVPISNQILAFAGKLGALKNTVVSLDDKDTKLEVATEIGYMEIGTKLAVAIIPGELEPAIAYGGYLDAAHSWTGTDFDYPCLQDIIGSNKELLVFGLTNDQIGYILEDNDYSSILSGVNEEIIATGNHAGSTTINAFKTLYSSIG